MKFSRGEFFKMIGGGAAAATALALPKSLVVAPGNVESHVALVSEIKDKDDKGHFAWYDVVPDILYSRFDPEDFADRLCVSLFVRSVMEYKRGLADTNMYMSGQMPAPEMFATGAIQIIADRGATEKELGKFERNMTGVLWNGCKSYAYPHMSRTLTSAALDDLIVRNRSSIIVKPGKFISSKVHRMNPPVVIGYSQAFHFDLRIEQSWRNNNNYKPTFGGYVLLDGHRARGVQ